MPKCRFIAIDSSTTATGAAIFDEGIFQYVKLMKRSSDEKMDDRFPAMTKDILEFLIEQKPDVLYVEETVVSRNAATQRFLTRIQGVIYSYCVMNDCEFNTIRPTEWRKYAGINQGKKKREDLKKEAVERVLKLYDIEVSDDEAEAILIGYAVLKKFEMIISIPDVSGSG